MSVDQPQWGNPEPLSGVNVDRVAAALESIADELRTRNMIESSRLFGGRRDTVERRLPELDYE